MKDIQTQSVKQFFDKIAIDYSNRYREGNSYHAFFFNERINHAIHGIDFEEKSVLDIGAGTGALYNAIREKFKTFNYTASDISQKMLSYSNIPLENQVHGDITELQFPAGSFDYIFMLGVSTYLSKENLKNHLHLFNSWLNNNGKIIISFTNRNSLDCFMRILLKPFSFVSRRKNSLIQQSFNITAYTPSEVTRLLIPTLINEHTIWHNQTITPFNHIFPQLSIKLAHSIKRYLPSFLLPYFSADFLMLFQKN